MTPSFPSSSESIQYSRLVDTRTDRHSSCNLLHFRKEWSTAQFLWFVCVDIFSTSLLIRFDTFDFDTHPWADHRPVHSY